VCKVFQSKQVMQRVTAIKHCQWVRS